jgi:hypothetical protein
MIEASLERSSHLPQLTQEECLKLLDEKPNPALETRRRRIQDVKDNSPLPPALRDENLKAALEARRKRMHDEHSSLPLSLSAGSSSKAGASPLSLRAQPKSDASLSGKSYALSLTTEERDAVYAATQQENPDADHKAFVLAYKVALWKAHRIKKGINPGRSMDAEDISLSLESGSEDSSGDDSDSSEDGMQGIRSDLERQKQVSPSTFSEENEYLTSFMKPTVKPQLEERVQQSLDKEPPLLPPPLSRQKIEHWMQNKGKGQVMLKDMAAACQQHMDPLTLIPQLAHK